jgi:phosphatidylglycerol lysyltransferase
MKRLKRAAAACTAARVVLAPQMGSPLRLLGRAAITLALGTLFVWLLSQRLAELDMEQLHTAVARVSAAQWLGAAGLTCAAFGAVGYYDAVLHRHFRTGTDEGRARRAGICAIAVSQTLGLGVITGAVLRWRMLPEQSFLMATKLTLAVAGSFLAGWAVVTSLALIVLPNAPYQGAAVLVLIITAAGAALSLIAPRWNIAWPNVFTMTRLIGLAAVDMVAAAAALYLLLAGGTVDFYVLLPAFLLAYGAGLVSGAPGGIGAFEITLLALLPAVDAPQLLAAVLAWRLVYFVIPALIGAGAAMYGPRAIDIAAARSQIPFARQVALFRVKTAIAETGIIAQGHLELTVSGGATWLTGRTGHTLCAVFDPLGAQDARALRGIRDTARSEGRLCSIYKAGPRLAVIARAQGWAAMICAREAVVETALFNLASPACAGLRRKLRRAQAAGVTCAHVGAGIIPWPQLDAIAADWTRAHGGERGFSMGRYTRSYVAGQRLYIAYQNGIPCAFVTFHTGEDAWTLDLMRHAGGTLDGTMHLLVAAAIADAANLGIKRVSLAAVSEPAYRAARGKLRGIFTVMRAADTGLLRFKDSFAPRWEGRYVLAPNWPALFLGCISIARAVARPVPLAECEPVSETQIWDSISAPST